MGLLAIGSVESAERCILENDQDSCTNVEVKDSELDNFEKVIDSAGIEIITRFQPVASDLRTVIVAMKVSSDLERIADLAVSITRRATRISGCSLGEFTISLRNAFNMAKEMIRNALESQSQSKEDLANLVIKKDSELDFLCREVDAKIAVAVGDDASKANELVQLAIIIRNIERLGDHAKNIAEDAIFLATGHDVRHSGHSTPPITN